MLRGDEQVGLATWPQRAQPRGACHGPSSHSGQWLFFGIEFQEQGPLISLFNWMCLSVPVAELMGVPPSLRGKVPPVGKDHRPGPQAPRPSSYFLFGMALGSYRLNRVYFMSGLLNMGWTLRTEAKKKQVFSSSRQVRADGNVRDHFTPLLNFFFQIM